MWAVLKVNSGCLLILHKKAHSRLDQSPPSFLAAVADSIIISRINKMYYKDLKNSLWLWCYIVLIDNEWKTRKNLRTILAWTSKLWPNLSKDISKFWWSEFMSWSENTRRLSAVILLSQLLQAKSTIDCWMRWLTIINNQRLFCRKFFCTPQGRISNSKLTPHCKN